MKNLLVLFLAVGLLLAVESTPARAQGWDIQSLIDGAAPGEVVSVPAGRYRVNLFLKAGVILEGAGADLTVLDGGGTGPVIVAEDGGVIKGFTITGGIEGVKASGSLTGIFENIITGNLGSGIRIGAGDAVIVNNLIRSNGQAGIDLARSAVLAANNTVCSNSQGFLFWKCPASTAVNNLVALSAVGLARDEESQPDFSNNLLVANQVDFEPSDFPGENFREAAIAGCRLPAASPYREAGVPVEGIPEVLTAGLGAFLPSALTLEDYLGVMEGFRGRLAGEETLVEYELLSETGVFRVSTFFPRPEFQIASSTAGTRIADPVALDRESGDRLIERLVTSAPPAVEVWGWGGVEYPRQEGRYVLESIFTEPESYFVDFDDILHFVRQTNFAQVRVLIPEGYSVESLSPEGEVDPATGAVTVLNPARALIEINLTLAPR